MLVKVLFLCAVFCLFGLSYAGVTQGRMVRIVSGGVVSSSGQVKSIQLGAMSRNGGKTQSRAGNSGSKASIGPRILPAAAKTSETGINGEFKLGDVYVYPNPAKGRQVPTFHAEVGIADSVKITVYTVSGDVAHDYTVTGQPDVVNDGNGPQYAYEYAWRGHIASGVYYFIAEAQKAGKKLRKTGKFAVVR